MKCVLQTTARGSISVCKDGAQAHSTRGVVGCCAGSIGVSIDLFLSTACLLMLASVKADAPDTYMEDNAVCEALWLVRGPSGKHSTHSRKMLLAQFHANVS